MLYHLHLQNEPQSDMKKKDSNRNLCYMSDMVFLIIYKSLLQYL